MAGNNKNNKGFCIYAGQFLVLGFLAAGWWGIMYPDFAMTDDIYRIVCEEESRVYSGEKEKAEEINKAVSGSEVFFEILKADSDSDKVMIKSRILELLTGLGGCQDEQEQCADRGI